MKRLLIIILFTGFSCFSQTFEVVNKGYYYGKVGDTVLPNRTTDLKALTDVQEHLENHNLEIGTVIRPSLEVKRKRTNPTVIRDTVYINSDISIGNQWMGEPVKEMKLTGTPIYDNGGSHNAGGAPEVLFDGDLETFRRAHSQQGAWTGLSFDESRIYKVRIYPVGLHGGTETNLNGAQIQYSTNGTNWITLHTVSGASIKNWYNYTFEAVTAKYIRVYCPVPFSYGGHIAELEIYRLL